MGYAWASTRGPKALETEEFEQFMPDALLKVGQQDQTAGQQ
jgi:hypothetical protein